jgi:hypothetical protein
MLGAETCGQVLHSITVRLAILTIAKMFDSVFDICIALSFSSPPSTREEVRTTQCRKKMGEKDRDISGKISVYRCHDKPGRVENKLVATCLGRTVLLHVYYIKFYLSTEGI